MTSALVPSGSLPLASAIDSINSSFSYLRTFPEEHHFSFENSRRFAGFARRLQLFCNQLLSSLHSPLETFPVSVQTGLKGISGDLSRAAEIVSIYEKSSKILVLINCRSLCSSLQEHTISIGGWLALLDTALQEHPGLQKKASDLCRDMKLAQFRVTENEERLQCTLEKEGQGRQTSKAVQSAIVMDLARALGIDPDNCDELSNQVQLFKNDLLRTNSVSERTILVSLERILDNWSLEPCIVTRELENIEDDVPIAAFKNFLCPLTKEVMKDPVVLESSQTYERTAIEYWFERCKEDGRYPTCPVSGSVLSSLELKPNIGLAGAIEEWVNRIIEHQIKFAKRHLNEEPLSIDHVERALDIVHKVSEEHPSSRYVVRNAGIVQLIVKVLSNSSKTIGSRLRSKALMALVSMARDEEGRKIMLEGGMTRLAVHSLIGSSEKERETAVKLLLEFSTDEACCIRIASEKGALVLLSSMVGNLEYPVLSNLAEEALRQLERVEDNVQCLAAAGRFEPLLSRLRDGSYDVKIEMASLVGSMTLTNASKEHIARQSARLLVELLSRPEGRSPSLQALYNLSGLDDNATILLDSAALPSLVEILFAGQDPSIYELKTLAASTIANIVSKPGHWELAYADKEGNSIQSEHIVFGLLGQLKCESSQYQVSVLHILCGIASSPRASELVASHIKSGDGFRTVMQFLEHPEVECRIYAFKLTRILSEWFSLDLANELRISNNLTVLKEKLLDNQATDDERADAACILANLSVSEDEVRTLLDGDFVRWTVNTLRNQRRSSNARISQSASGILEGLLGLLLHFTSILDQQALGVIRENRLMAVFCEHLDFISKPKIKELAALGLKNLSEFGKSVTARASGTPTSNGFCSSLLFICGRASTHSSICLIHNCLCKDDNQLCLLKSNCIKPLVDLLSDNDTSVQVAAVEALSTLVLDSTSNSFKRAVDELERLGVVEAVVTLFTEVRSGELQEKTVWMIEKILRAENHTQRHSLNQSLVRGLVEAFKHGNTNTRNHAQDALTHLKQISGVSGKTSSQTLAQR